MKLLDKISESAKRMKAYRLARWDNQQNYEHDEHIYKVNKKQKTLYFLSNVPIFLFIIVNFTFDSVYNPSTTMYLVGVLITGIVMYAMIITARIAFLRESDYNQIK